MRIHGDKLSRAMAKAGVETARLAESLAEPGFAVSDADRALRNWSSGRDHPRCKPATIRKIAEALSVAPKDLVKFTSEIRHHRGTPRKARLLADLVRGKPVDKALNLLTFTTKRAAVNMKKALAAAVADAELAEADVTRLYVSESRVDDAVRMKRFQPKDRGRAHPIIKAMSHITISVEEKPEKAS